MDVVAGKNGSFFVTTDNVDTDTIKKLADISFDEFGRYNAWSTMKKIARISGSEYAAKKNLRLDILEKFDRFAEAVDYKATQDLMYFIGTESGREQVANERSELEINPDNYKNGFAIPSPREVSGMITDSFHLKEADVPKMLKKIGVSITRSVVSHFVKWNNVTYKVDVIPATPGARKGAFNGAELVVGENCYVFQSDDWNCIKQIEDLFNKEKQARKSWYRIEKPDEEIFSHALKKVCKDPKQQIVYTALYQKYTELKEAHTNYRGIFVHEFCHLRNKVLIENRFLKTDVRALQAPDMYFILVEDERSSHLAVAIDRVNVYWQDHDWDKLVQDEPCFAVLAERSEAERNKLLQNLDFVVNVKLKHWTENSLDLHYKKIMHRMPWLQSYCSVAKGMDESRQEYMRIRSMLYSFFVYNPFTQRYKMMRLDKHIKIDIPVENDAAQTIISRAQSVIDRRLGSKDMLGIKYGIGSDLIRKAANIYDRQWRIKHI